MSLRTCSPSFFRRRSQAVRQRPAKPLFPGSNPGGASQGWSPPCCRRPGSNRSVRAERRDGLRICGLDAFRETSEDCRRQPQVNSGGAFLSRPPQTSPLSIAGAHSLNSAPWNPATRGSAEDRLTLKFRKRPCLSNHSFPSFGSKIFTKPLSPPAALEK